MQVPWFLTTVTIVFSLAIHVPVAEASNKLPPRLGDEHGSDVVLLLKTFVADRDLCQPPLIVYPGCKSSEARDALCKIARNEVPGTLSLKVF